MHSIDGHDGYCYRDDGDCRVETCDVEQKEISLETKDELQSVTALRGDEVESGQMSRTTRIGCLSWY